MKPFPIEKIIASFEQQLTEEEEKQLEKWLAESAENQKLYNETRKVVDASKKTQLNFRPDARKALQQVNRKLKTKQIARWAYRAAAVFIVLLLATKILFLSAESQWHEITAENRRIVYLTDHSKVILAENATFKYPEKFGKKQRNVYLNGKAYFEITKDAKRPFIVETSHTHIKVLGTRFLVDAAADSAQKVFVDQGKVAFSSRSSNQTASLILTKNKAGTWLATNNSLTETNFSNLNQNAWLSGRLRFENASLEDVLTDLEKYFNIKAMCHNSIKNMKYSGTFTENIAAEKTLQIIATTLNVQISKTGNTYFIQP